MSLLRDATAHLALLAVVAALAKPVAAVVVRPARDLSVDRPDRGRRPSLRGDLPLPWRLALLADGGPSADAAETTATPNSVSSGAPGGATERATAVGAVGREQPPAQQPQPQREQPQQQQQAQAQQSEQQTEKPGPPQAKPSAQQEQSEAAIEPLSNDTISEEYWIKVNTAIAAASQATRPPISWNDATPGPPAEPWRRVFEVSERVNVLDTPAAADIAPPSGGAVNHWRPRPSVLPGGEEGELYAPMARNISIVPYDVQLGARIMYGLSEKVPSTPPPNQVIADEAFTARCPILMFGGRLDVRGPACGEPLGSWADPRSGRSILRWQDDGQGGVLLGVDSAVHGAGSVLFGKLSPSVSVTGAMFGLYNCLGVQRFSVEEASVRVNSVSARTVYSQSLGPNAVPPNQEVTMYEYVVRHPGGTVVAKSTLFRRDQDRLNVSLYDEVTGVMGGLVAIAARKGHWKRDGWNQCTENPRGWELQFPNSSFATAASVQDLRVAASAIINLMAFRDAASVGVGHGNAALWGLLLTAANVMFGFLRIFVVLAVVAAISFRYNLPTRLRRFCFRLEQVLLPKRPTKVRQPVLHPTY